MRTRTARCLIFPLLLVFSFCIPANAAWQIGLSDGRVALFEDGRLVEQSHTPAHLLPEQDQAQLRAGLRFSTRAEATRRMEDFCS